jgi:UDP-N-acetylmuramate dehydrogenase
MTLSDLTMTTETLLDMLQERFGQDVKTEVPLAPFTAARIGGPADVLITVRTAEQLETCVTLLWQEGIEPVVLGGGSNVLIGDNGIRGVTVINRAKAVRIQEGDSPSVWTESGTSLSNLANRCALRGLSGLEWAGTVPGTVGGAIYGNAGAFGGDMAGSLEWVYLLTNSGQERLTAAAMGYGYRTSVLKRQEINGLVLAAELRLEKAEQHEVSARMAAFGEKRKTTQPPGASMGSMFKNPPDDKAGRLLDEAGLKGRRVGDAEISPVHANFIVNHGHARAEDVRALLETARNAVKAKFGVDLELEIELIGE